ncbi:hypothetical protein [Burkholderia sp. Se-20378]|uniref:hypothetical protein n=1 Tax=Burkholderia sp. Se-20378 TaxID=2703899 RepID=UPI00197F0E2C|nr:hypothetical protein [Burkholderia sp. Se-20378]MBN3771189.1 hypothetical protein [Burkholderia sp. Se-20378]
MKMFSKTNDKAESAVVMGVKRDVTISDEPKKRPDHVRVESDECTWKIGLTLDEQHELGSAYERGINDEESFLSLFADRIYRSCANTLTVEFKPCEPGKVSLSVSADNPNFAAEGDRAHLTVPYREVGALIVQLIEKSQSRKDLISDLVTSLQRSDA